MAYIIKIQEVTTELKNVGGAYGVVGQDDNGKNVYGYAPDRKQDVPVELEIYSQRVEELDLAAVVKAINKL